MNIKEQTNLKFWRQTQIILKWNHPYLKTKMGHLENRIFWLLLDKSRMFLKNNKDNKHNNLHYFLVCNGQNKF